MSWDDWNNFNNNENDHQEKDDNNENNDNLDSFLSEDSDDNVNNDHNDFQHEKEDTDQQHVVIDDQVESDDKDVQEQEDEEAMKDIEELSEEFYNAPGNTKNDPIFSEKDAYRIVNVTKVLEECDHDMNVMLQSTFGFNAKASIIKKAINIVQLTDEEFLQLLD